MPDGISVQLSRAIRRQQPSLPSLFSGALRFLKKVFKGCRYDGPSNYHWPPLPWVSFNSWLLLPVFLLHSARQESDVLNIRLPRTNRWETLSNGPHPVIQGAGALHNNSFETEETTQVKVLLFIEDLSN